MFLNALKQSVKVSNTILRHCSNKIVREYEVPPRCNINANIVFNTIISPRDAIEITETDKVIIKCDKTLQCNQVGDSINISSPNEVHDKETLCEIEAPIKSNLNITSTGNINVANFHGDAIRLFSESGNILIANSKNDEIAARTNVGNIKTEGSLEAGRVTFKTLKAGNVSANKIKCLGLQIETDDGEIATEACYSNQSYFVTRQGKLNLQNVHRHCKIMVLNEGSLNMVGFDGILEVTMQKGIADIQISSIKKNSEIIIKGEANLVLRLGDDVLENVQVEVTSKCCMVEDNIAHEESDVEEQVFIKPRFVKESNCRLLVQCPETFITIRAASWSDMIKKAMSESATQNI